MYEDELVSVVIPTLDRAELLLTRSIPSVMAQGHQNWRLLVVGDGATPEVEAAMATVTDPRVSFTNRPQQFYPTDGFWKWNVIGADAINYGLDQISDGWCSTLGDDDELMPDFMDHLLGLALQRDWDMVYGRSEVVGHGFLGNGQPACGSQTNSMLWRISEIRQDPESYKQRLPADWVLMRDIIASGVPWGFSGATVHRYYPAHSIPGTSPS